MYLVVFAVYVVDVSFIYSTSNGFIIEINNFRVDLTNVLAQTPKMLPTVRSDLVLAGNSGVTANSCTKQTKLDHAVSRM